ncbi:MAG TPA: hypothetical protein VFL91_31405 [Thermomicrobiales bacterium]|nr:hypothetical protein [Thermomicrobiales bacterium]
MRRYTRQELLQVTGAQPEELAALEARGLLRPNYAWRPFGPRRPFYTATQLDVLRFLLRSRRAWEACRRATAALPRADPPAREAEPNHAIESP